MRTRQLWLLNAALAGFAMLLGSRIAANWRQDQSRYAALARRSAAAASPMVLPAPSTVAFAGGEIVARNPFSSDRNNSFPQPAAVVRNAPLPIVIGTMNLGADYEALMSESAATGPEKFRRVKVGGAVGPYTVAEIRDEAVVVELGGQKTTVNVYQSARAVRQAAAPLVPAVVAATGPAAPAPVVVSSGAPPAPAPPGNTNTANPRGVDLTPPFPGVTVTIEGNRKRFERFTAFGPQVWYEDIK